MSGRPHLAAVAAETWDAIGSIATAGALIIALGALAVAWGQAQATRTDAAADRDLSRAIALDQSRPYVLLYAARSPVNFSSIDVALHNVGAGPAYNVRVVVDPPLQRVREIAEAPAADARIFTRPIPMLPPHFEMRTYLDDARERNQQQPPPPGAHGVRITYDDGHGNAFDERSELDLTTWDGGLFTEEYGVHHAAEALRKIAQHLEKRDQTERQQSMAERMAAMRRARDAADAEQQTQPPAPTDGD